MTNKVMKIKIIKKIARGGFGEVYLCIDGTTNTEMAIKLEKKTCIDQLSREKVIYDKLSGPNTPKVFEYGQLVFKGVTMNFMTMELLGQSLEKLFSKSVRSFSKKTVFMIGKACLARIEGLHHKHYIHRDIKPDNFVTNLAKDKIYLIDYGLSKYYRSPTTLAHIPYKCNKNLTGTARYASLATHHGIEQSRRDDLESLGFMLVYFLKGKLPWQGLKAETKVEKYANITQVKEEHSIFKLCMGLPNEIYLYLLHVRNLSFKESPDYSYLETLFDNALKSEGLEDDGVYDWIENNY